MKFTRIVRIMTAITIATSVFALSACGVPNANKPANDKAGSGSAEPVTLRFAIWDVNAQPVLEEIAKKFSEKYPNIKVNIEVTPYDQYVTKLQAGTAAGTAPDVFWMNPLQFLYYANGSMLLPLDDRLKDDKEVSLDNYPKTVVNMYTNNNKTYGLPFNVDDVGLWYNKSLFDAAGIKYPDETWDWGKLVDTAKKLTDPSKGVWGIAADLNRREGYYDTVYQAGGFIISPDKKTSGFDQPGAVEGIKFWTDMINKYKVSPTLAQMTDTPAISLFESGKVAMIFGGSWKQIEFGKNEYTKNKVDVTVLPKGKERATVVSALSDVIYAKTKHPKESWEFVKFLSSKEGADIVANSGLQIPALNGTSDAWVKSNPNFHLQAFVDMLSDGKENPSSLNTSKWQSEEINYLRKAWTGEMTPEEAANQFSVKMNQLLAQEGK